MTVYRYETPKEEIVKNCVHIHKSSVFLAGPTVRGHQQHLGPSWRFEAIDKFEKLGFDGAIIVPEFSDPSESDKGKVWIPRWEESGMKICSALMFWVPRTRELIGLTTNFEFGYWFDASKTFYGRPDGSYRTDYMDNVWLNYPQFNSRPRHLLRNDLGELTRDVVSYLNCKYL